MAGRLERRNEMSGSRTMLTGGEQWADDRGGNCHLRPEGSPRIQALVLMRLCDGLV